MSCGPQCHYFAVNDACHWTNNKGCCNVDSNISMHPFAASHTPPCCRQPCMLIVLCFPADMPSASEKHKAVLPAKLSVAKVSHHMPCHIYKAVPYHPHHQHSLNHPGPCLDPLPSLTSSAVAQLIANKGPLQEESLGSPHQQFCSIAVGAAAIVAACRCHS